MFIFLYICRKIDQELKRLNNDFFFLSLRYACSTQVVLKNGAMAVNFEHSFSDGMDWVRMLGEVTYRTIPYQIIPYYTVGDRLSPGKEFRVLALDFRLISRGAFSGIDIRPWNGAGRDRIAIPSCPVPFSLI